MFGYWGLALTAYTGLKRIKVSIMFSNKILSTQEKRPDAFESSLDHAGHPRLLLGPPRSSAACTHQRSVDMADVCAGCLLKDREVDCCVERDDVMRKRLMKACGGSNQW